MTLSSGARVGPYEILGLLGAGGMGEVYRALDTRLGRHVAIKFAAEKFSERFEREARAVASLNHPHICTLHDVGPNYLVMEMVDGHPLAGPLPLDRALLFAKQILSALAAAHDKGITHRDLKPGNILVTAQGVKLLDFGLAKLGKDLQTATTGHDTDNALTRAQPLTGERDRFLNEVAPFDDVNPSAENIARHVARGIVALLEDDRVRLHRVEVWETDTCCATWYAP